jgi:hypothetical protein
MGDAAETGGGGSAIPRDRSAKCKNDQARAKQHKACSGYREESIGHEVIMTHSSPTAPNADPNLLKNSKSAAWQKRAA